MGGHTRKRQRECEARSTPAILSIDGSSVRFDDALADREPQAAAARTPGPKGLEDPLQVHRCNRRAVVLDPCLQERLACNSADRNGPCRRRPLDSILEQVGENAPNLQLVHLDRWQVIGELDCHLVSVEVRPQLA